MNSSTACESASKVVFKWVSAPSFLQRTKHCSTLTTATPAVYRKTARTLKSKRIPKNAKHLYEADKNQKND